MAALQQCSAALRSNYPPPHSPLRPAVHLPSLRSSAFPPLRLRHSLTLRRNRRRGGATMMSTAAGSYATALSDLAQSNGTLDATRDDMEKVAELFADPAVAGFFRNPTVAIERKQSLVDDIASSSSLQPHTANFIKITVEMKRTDLMGDIAKEFDVCYNRVTGTMVALVTSVVPLEEAQKAQIAQGVQRLTGAKNVRIRTAIDPSLVAGFTIRYGPSGSKLVDLSIKKQLDEIAQQLEFNVELVDLTS